jgi:hypothetical protein
VSNVYSITLVAYRAIKDYIFDEPDSTEVPIVPT